MLLEALAPVHVRKAQGWSKADAVTIAAAREKALQSRLSDNDLEDIISI